MFSTLYCPPKYIAVSHSQLYIGTVGLKIGAHFYFVSLISQRVFNFRSPTIAYDNPQLQQIVISYSIFGGEYVAVKLWGTQNL